MNNEETEAIELISRLPEDETLDDIMEALYFKQQVDRGLRDVVEDRVLSHDELRQRIVEWRKSAGPAAHDLEEIEYVSREPWELG